MKKMLLMAAAAMFTIVSCSDDSDSNPDDNNPSDYTLLKKEVVSYATGDGWTAIYSYNGNKLNTINYGNGEYDKATYEGNNITKYEMFGAGDLQQDVIFEYDDNNRLIKTSERMFNNDGAEPTIDFIRMRQFTYETDNIINFQEYMGIENPVAGWTGSFTFQNGNLVRIVRGDSEQLTTFDTKNSPYRNILGMDKLAMVDLAEGPKNNLISYSYGYTSSVPNTNSTTYTYNEHDYPITGTTVGYHAKTTQYFYE